MAEGGTLTSLAAVKKQLGIGQHGTLLTLDDDLLIDYVITASRAVETFCGRNFTAWGNGTLQKTFDYDSPPVFGRVLYLDNDLLSVTRLENDGNSNSGTITSDKYRLLPSNDTPKYAIELLQGSSYAWTYDDTPEDAIKIIGTWGYSNTPPKDVEDATTHYAAWLYQTRDSTGERVQYADGTVVIPSSAPAIVFNLLRRYVKVTVTP